MARSLRIFGRSRKVGTDGSLLESLPWTLIALGFAVAPHVQFLPMWITLALVACAAARLQIERKRWRLPPTWLRIVLSLICFIGVLATYESVSGVGPGSALLAIMAALKLLETKKRRDQFVLLFIAIFLIMSSLLREQYLWSLPYLVAGVVLVMTAWMRMSPGYEYGIRQSMRTGVRMMLYAAPLTIAMWIFFPRIATPFWAVPIDTSAASSGLSDTMSPGDISSLSLSDSVAFRARFVSSIPRPAERYWRGLVLHRFNGRTWSGSEPSIGTSDRWPTEYLGKPVRYQVTLEPTNQQWVFALDVPFEWTLDKTFMGQQQQLARAIPIDQRVSFEAVSYTEYRLNNDLNRFARSYYLRLPEDANPRTRELGQRMRADAASDTDYVDAVMRMFHEQEFFYTLEPPALGSNPVDQFIFGTRRGFCEHYASAFAVMMRAAGIPSRIVLGYQGGEMNPMGEYMIVRQADAHAWTEVWIPDRGWHRVDPTAAVAPERILSGMSGVRFDAIGASWGLDAPSRLLHRLTLTWDALNAEWNEWILGYGPENQSRFMEWLGMNQPDWQKMMLTMLLVAAGLTVGIALLLALRYRKPRQDAPSRLYGRFVSQVGILPARGETPRNYAARIAMERHELSGPASEITGEYLAARYGDPDPLAIARLRSAVRRFGELA